MKQDTFNALLAWGIVLVVVCLGVLSIAGKIAFAINNIMWLFK